MIGMPIRTLCLFLVACLTTVAFAQERLRPLPTPKRPESRPVAPKFIVGVYMQPPDTFDVWRARGVNTLVGYESRGGSISNKDWSDAAAAKGLFYIRRPPGVVEIGADAQDPNLLAWMHDDEPDVKKPPTDPEKLLADYKMWKAMGPNVPVFVNFSGGHVLGGKVGKETYAEYMKAADWFGNDFYPVTGYNRPDWLWKVGAAVDQLREWSGGRPQFAFIETSAQRLSWTPKTTRGVTPDELRALLWHSVIHGANGVVYFPQQIGEGFKYDATPQRVALEMSKQNRRLTELGDVLSGPQNPKEFKAEAASPLEVGWRVAGNKAYVVALNFSDDVAKARPIKVTGGAVASALWETRDLPISNWAITDHFGPYDVHLYVIEFRN
jgi:hypothetical protein